MQLTTYRDANAFLQNTQAALEQQEVVNSLILGISLRMRDAPEYSEAPPYMATVDNDGRLVLAAVMTPPHRLVLASAQTDCQAAFKLVLADLLAAQWHVPGVNGPVPLSAQFADQWHGATQQQVNLLTALRTFQLTTVRPPPTPPGRMRVATMADSAMLEQWVAAFGNEALRDAISDPGRAKTVVARNIRNGNYFLWENNGPVALAGRTRPTSHGITIGPVYTPPAFRRQGYASALVATLSQFLLDEGRQYVTLFTDLANPTSNKIYQQIGFQPVCDFAEYGFGDGG